MEADFKLDNTDKFLISELIKNGRIKYTELAKKLKVTPVAIKERVERLIKLKVIQPTVLLNAKMFPIKAWVGVEGDAECVNTIWEKLKNCPLVESLVRTSGTHNLVLFLVAKSLEHLETFLNNQLRNEPGIKHVDVNIGNNILPEFTYIRFYTNNQKYLPCGLKRTDKNICRDCPMLEGG
jgi:DNA-binding Lrp family transcriptional regulator